MIPIKPLENFWVNVSDGLLLLNLVIMFIGVLYYDIKDASTTGDERDAVMSQATSFSTVLVSLAYLQFAVILLYHLVAIRFPQLQDMLKKIMAVKAFARSRLEKKDAEERTPIASDHGSRVDYSSLREPALEEEWNDYTPTHVRQTT